MSDAQALPEVMRRLDPPDELQIRLLMSVPPERRVRTMMDTADSIMDGLCVRLRKAHPDKSDLEICQLIEAWCARPEDVVVGKLMAWKEGRSTKHEWDIRDILTAARLGEDELSREFDLTYVDNWAGRLGPEVEFEWRGLKGQARLE